MKILLVSVNRCREPAPVLPLGACLVAEAAVTAGHSVRLLDLMFAVDPGRELYVALRKFAPHVVGFSARNLDNTTMEKPEDFTSELPSLVKIVREWGKAPVVLGGSAVGIAAEGLLRLTRADWAVTGPGEETFLRLIDAVAGGGQPEELPGVSTIRYGEFLRQPPTFASHPFRFPDIPRWVDLRPYRRQGSSFSLQTKRGCPFTCTYCPCPNIEGADYRLAPADRVAAEIRHLAAMGVRDVEFVDTVFNAPYEHALALCEEIAAKPVRVRLHTFELNPAFLDERLLSAMMRAGFASIGLTAESAAGDVLDGLGKNYGPEELECAADVLTRTPLPCLWIFMFGGPGETPRTVEETLRFARRRLRPKDVAFLSAGIRIYPGTDLAERAWKEGRLSEECDLLSPVFYLSPGIGREELRSMIRKAVEEDHRFVTYGMESLRFLPTIRRLSVLLGMAPPLWRHTSRVRRGLARMGIRESSQAFP